MRYKIIYDKPGRLRVRCGADVFEKTQEVPLCARLLRLPYVLSAKASHINGGILVFYNKDFRSELLGEIAEIKAKSIEKGEISQLDVLDAEFKRDFQKS